MTPARLDECLEILGWSGRDLGSLLTLDESTIRKWRSGARPIPGPVGAWVDQLATTWAAMPPPPNLNRPGEPVRGRPRGGLFRPRT